MKDLHKTLKGVRARIPKKEFKESIVALCKDFLRQDDLTKEERTQIYRIFAQLNIRLKDWS